VTQTSETDQSADAAQTAKKRTGGLNSMLLADLKQMAGGMGISGAGSMKKAQLVEAIKAARSSQSGPSTQSGPTQTAPAQGSERGRGENGQAEAPEPDRDEARQSGAQNRGQQGRQTNQQTRNRQNAQQGNQQNAQQGNQQGGQQGNQQGNQQNRNQQGVQNRNQDQSRNQNRNQDRDQDRDQDPNRDQDDPNQAEGEAGRRNRRRRGRDRDRARPVGQRNEPDTTILEDDVLVPAAGILDVLDNYAFVRTSGYLPGADDVYVSLSMVRKFGLRPGDAIVGQVRQPREGERREKFNPMVRIDSVNGADPDSAKNRVEFSKLTPLYPSERLRLETDPSNVIGRVIDIAAPIGKGQRGLIVSPAKAGKTMVMQSIANSITTNNPECHLMVVLVDERPEEVTDFERSVKGEVISSTFDRPPSDHTMVAELAIERAKRLVELGHDVVILLDGITRLGRAYNLAAPASGRILSGGVDSAALYPPKKFFGAARNIEGGGSLTILATALIESGSKMDEVIFEEFKGTGNMEIRLRREFAEKRIFPAIDAVQSSTRREEYLVDKDELAIVWKLRRVLSSLEGQQALELLLERLKKTQTNAEFLLSVQKTTPTAGGEG
jgi:transcription termination factor Rho